MIKVGGCEAKSLCPNAQTKTHVSISLQSHFAARGHYTTRARPTVYAQRAKLANLVHLGAAVPKEGSEVLELLRMWEHCLPVLGLQEVDRVRVCGAGLARAQPVRIEDV